MSKHENKQEVKLEVPHIARGHIKHVSETRGQTGGQNEVPHIAGNESKLVVTSASCCPVASLRIVWSSLSSALNPRVQIERAGCPLTTLFRSRNRTRCPLSASWHTVGIIPGWHQISVRGTCGATQRPQTLYMRDSASCTAAYSLGHKMSGPPCRTILLASYPDCSSAECPAVHHRNDPTRPCDSCLVYNRVMFVWCLVRLQNA